MDPRWTAIKREFARVHDAAPEDRPALLAALPEEIRTEVQSLVEALDGPDALAPGDAREYTAGATVGPYRLIEEIGRGGMGVVFRAERADGEISRHLALKVAGGRIFGPEAQRRFIRERQILARLEHPHIVRLLDGGVEAGQRYFVMELAEGVPITTYCQERRLPIGERIRLFRQVCSAIQYAHERLVLHRDIKPANVIVTASGAVKVLDFGIAQIVQPDTLTADTRTALHPLSFASASPEQLRGAPLALTSDVYSLGTLLYEVLTGVNPQYRADASLDEALRLVLEAEPPRPSQLARSVPRDLDAVTMKALAKAPADRYPSVAAFDADLARWQGGRPVSAVPPRPWYVAARFVRRNRLLSATAAALVVSVAAGLAAVTRQARIAERRFEDARQLIRASIFDIQPRLEAIPGTLELRQTLIEQTMRYLESVSREAGGNVPLLQELSNAYLQLARVQGDITTSNLGDTATAENRFNRARLLMEQALAIEPDNAGLLKDATLLHLRLAAFENGLGRSEAALAASRRAASFAERNLAARPGEFDAREILAGALFTVGLNIPAESWDERRQWFGRALEAYRALAEENPDREPVVRNISLVSRNLASLHYDRGMGAEGVPFGRESLQVSEAVLEKRPADTALQLEVATSAYVLGMVLDQAGEQRDAAGRYERGLRLLETLRSADTSNARVTLLLADATRHYAANRLAAGDLEAAERLATQSTALFRTLGEPDQMAHVVRWRYAAALATAADVDRAAGRREGACSGYRRAADLFAVADRQSALSDTVKRDFDRSRERARACPAP